MSTPRHSRLIILGSGPAGYTAAVYAARANRKPLLITGLAAGRPADDHHRRRQLAGRRRMACTGPALMERMQAHAERFDTEIVFDHIHTRRPVAAPVRARRRQRRLHLRRADHRHRRLAPSTSGSPSEQTFMGRGVSACATCDGFFYKRPGRRGGRRRQHRGRGSALPVQHRAHVTLVHRRDKFRAEKILQDKLFERERAGKIELVWNHTVDEVLGDDERRDRRAHRADRRTAPRASST